MCARTPALFHTKRATQIICRSGVPNPPLNVETHHKILIIKGANIGIARDGAAKRVHEPCLCGKGSWGSIIRRAVKNKVFLHFLMRRSAQHAQLGKVGDHIQ
jgi:hypothetical protein